MNWDHDRNGTPYPSNVSGGLSVAAAVFVFIVVVAACIFAPARPDAEDAAIRQNIEAGREAMR